MTEQLRLMAILAHPDDESLGFGGTLAKYSANNVETYVVTATRGEIGWQGPPEENPGKDQLGKIREGELLAAAGVLGIKEIQFLDYIDGELDQADPEIIIGKITRLIRRIKPQVIITFGPKGAYGHPDHIAISQFSAAAIISAANDKSPGNSRPPHAVSKFYYRIWTEEEQKFYRNIFGDIEMPVDGQIRSFTDWEDWSITTRIDSRDCWPTVWEAVNHHKSQLPTYSALANLTIEQHMKLWGQDGFYRVFSTVNGGRQRESDLFEGIR